VSTTVDILDGEGASAADRAMYLTIHHELNCMTLLDARFYQKMQLNVPRIVADRSSIFG